MIRQIKVFGMSVLFLWRRHKISVLSDTFIKHGKHNKLLLTPGKIITDLLLTITDKPKERDIQK